MIGVGIVGYGYWGPNLLRNFSEVPGCRVVAVSDLQDARLAKVRSRYPAVKTTTSFEDLMRDPHVDAAVIASSTTRHRGSFATTCGGRRRRSNRRLRSRCTATGRRAIRLRPDRCGRSTSSSRKATATIPASSRFVTTAMAYRSLHGIPSSSSAGGVRLSRCPVQQRASAR